MKRSLVFALSLVVVSVYAAAPQAVTEVKKEATQDTCKCDAKCVATCACPKCPKKEATTKAKEAVATQAVANKQAEVTKAKN